MNFPVVDFNIIQTPLTNFRHSKSKEVGRPERPSYKKIIIFEETPTRQENAFKVDWGWVIMKLFRSVGEAKDDSGVQRTE